MSLLKSPLTVELRGSAEPHSWTRVRRIAGSPPLRDYISARLLDMIATWMFRLTNSWVVWKLTGSPTMVGVALAFQLGPAIFIEPIGGAFADRYDRRKIMAITQTISAIVTAAFGVLALWGHLRIEYMLVLLLCHGSVNAVSQASSKTIVTALVTNHELPTAVSLYSVAFHFSAFIGPAIAGILIAIYGAPATYLISAAMTLIFVLLLSRVPPIKPRSTPAAAGIFPLFREGLNHVLSDPLLRLLFALHVATATLSRPFLEFVPGIIDQIFQGGASEVAIVTSTVGLGSILGGLWLASRDPASLLTVALIATPALGVAMCLLVWSPTFYAVPVIALLAGLGMIARGAAIQSMLQLEAGRAFRGRIAALYGVSLDFGAILGTFLIGIAAEFLGFRWAVTASVIVVLLCWWALRDPLINSAKDKDIFEEH